MKRRKIILSCICLVVAITACIMCYLNSHPTFTEKKWQRADIYDREALAKAFLSDIYHEGMTVDQVKSYLGEPDFNDPSANCISYIVGNVSIDMLILTFYVNEKGLIYLADIWKTS